MELEAYFEFLEPDAIRIRGHRIGIESILFEYLERHKTPEQIAKRFPTLSLEQIYATILYYLHNQEQVERYLKDDQEAFDRAYEEQERNPPPVLLRLRRLREERERAKHSSS